MTQFVQLKLYFIHTKLKKCICIILICLNSFMSSLDMVLYFTLCDASLLSNIRTNLSCSVGTTFRIFNGSQSQVQSHINRHWQEWMMVDVCHTCQKVFCHPFPRSHTFILEAKVPNVPKVVRCRALHSSQLPTQKTLPRFPYGKVTNTLQALF